MLQNQLKDFTNLDPDPTWTCMKAFFLYMNRNVAESLSIRLQVRKFGASRNQWDMDRDPEKKLSYPTRKASTEINVKYEHVKVKQKQLQSPRIFLTFFNLLLTIFLNI